MSSPLSNSLLLCCSFPLLSLEEQSGFFATKSSHLLWASEVAEKTLLSLPLEVAAAVVAEEEEEEEDFAEEEEEEDFAVVAAVKVKVESKYY